MTVEDAARLVSPAYAAAADQVAQLRQHAEEAKTTVERCKRDQRYLGEEERAALAQHGLVAPGDALVGGAHRPIKAYADRRRGLAAEIEALAPYRAELAPAARGRKAGGSRPCTRAAEAVAELARRQERAGLAHTVLGERHRTNGRSAAPGSEQKTGGWGCTPRTAAPSFTAGY